MARNSKKTTKKSVKKAPVKKTPAKKMVKKAPVKKTVSKPVPETHTMSVEDQKAVAKMFDQLNSLKIQLADLEINLGAMGEQKAALVQGIKENGENLSKKINEAAKELGLDIDTGTYLFNFQTYKFTKQEG